MTKHELIHDTWQNRAQLFGFIRVYKIHTMLVIWSTYVSTIKTNYSAAWTFCLGLKAFTDVPAGNIWWVSFVPAYCSSDIILMILSFKLCSLMRNIHVKGALIVFCKLCCIFVHNSSSHECVSSIIYSWEF